MRAKAACLLKHQHNLANDYAHLLTVAAAYAQHSYRVIFHAPAYTPPYRSHLSFTISELLSPILVPANLEPRAGQRFIDTHLRDFFDAHLRSGQRSGE